MDTARPSSAWRCFPYVSFPPPWLCHAHAATLFCMKGFFLCLTAVCTSSPPAYITPGYVTSDCISLHLQCCFEIGSMYVLEGCSWTDCSVWRLQCRPAQSNATSPMLLTACHQPYAISRVQSLPAGLQTLSQHNSQKLLTSWNLC